MAEYRSGRLVLVMSLITGLGTAVAQQAPPRPDTSSFELTSVKRNVSGSESASNRNQPNASFSGTYITLKNDEYQYVR